MPSGDERRIGVLFCCTGNICRSPTAEGVFRKRVAEAGLQEAIFIDSAGTHDYHVGKPPDARTSEAALRRGYDLSALRARQVIREDFNRFDLVLAMDRANHLHLSRLCVPARADRLGMMMEYARRYAEIEVPDPYYGGEDGFELVLDMLEDASCGLLHSLRRGLIRA